VPAADFGSGAASESMYFLSRDQAGVIRSKSKGPGLALLERYVGSLPSWVHHRLVARALGHSTAAIEVAESRHGSNYA